MRIAWQLAALAAGTVAAPGKEAHLQDKRVLQDRQYNNSSTTPSIPSPYSTTTVDLSTTNTVYTSLNVTVTICSDSVSSCPASSTSTSSSSTSTDVPSISTITFPSTPSSGTSTSSSSSIPASLSSVVSEAYAAWTTGQPESTPSSASGKFDVAVSTEALTDSNIAPPSLIAPPAPDCTLLPTTPLTNEEQVGYSLLGTLCAPYLPQWLDQSPTPPWGSNRTVFNSDATIKHDIPITNVTRYYEFTITRGRISPDGVLRDVILINDQYPGPVIQANWGDMIQVIVHNNISDPFEGTSVHWHGQTQRNTPWEDGVPALGQCPIAPGHSFTYFYQAELQGTSWYHAHYSAQFTAGVLGPMVVYGPSALPYDIDVGPVMLSDWYHIPYFAIVADAVGTNYSLIPPTSDSVLINGRGQFNCSNKSYDSSSELLASNLESNITWTCVDDAPLSAFRFQSTKMHRLRLINNGANGVQKFSIDHHNLTVIATDYVPTLPYTTNVVTLGVGQRTDVLVQAVNDPKASVWMRTSAPGGETCGGSDQPETLAAIYYEDADTTVAPASISHVSDDSCVNDALNLTTPTYAITPSTNHWKQDLTLSLVLNETGSFEFQINGEAYHADYNVPLLPQLAAGNFTFDPKWQVYYFYDNTSIILNVTNDMPLTHPFHLHGHNFYVLNVGDNSSVGSNALDKRQGGPTFLPGATWDGTVINPSNPMRRDTILIPPYGFAAIQFELDNPGVWPFHCHIAWHLSGGQGMNIAYNYTGITPLPEGFVEESCADWDFYSSRHIIDQIDSGA